MNPAFHENIDRINRLINFNPVLLPKVTPQKNGRRQLLFTNDGFSAESGPYNYNEVNFIFNRFVAKSADVLTENTGDRLAAISHFSHVIIATYKRT